MVIMFDRLKKVVGADLKYSWFTVDELRTGIRLALDRIYPP